MTHANITKVKYFNNWPFLLAQQAKRQLTHC